MSGHSKSFPTAVLEAINLLPLQIVIESEGINTIGRLSRNKNIALSITDHRQVEDQ